MLSDRIKIEVQKVMVNKPLSFDGLVNHLESLCIYDTAVVLREGGYILGLYDRDDLYKYWQHLFNGFNNLGFYR